MPKQPEITLEQVLAALSPDEYPPMRAATQRVRAAIYDQYGRTEEAAAARALAEAIASEERALEQDRINHARNQQYEQEREQRSEATAMGERMARAMLAHLGASLMAVANGKMEDWPS